MRSSWQPVVHSLSSTTPAPQTMHWSCQSICAVSCSMTGGSAGLSPCCSSVPCRLPRHLLRGPGSTHECLSRKTCVPLLQVSGRVAALAMSHTASRVIQACAKHGSPAHRQALMQEVAEKPIDVAKSSYGHFLVCRLIALAEKEELAGQWPARASQHCSALIFATSGCAALSLGPARVRLHGTGLQMAALCSCSRAACSS